MDRATNGVLTVALVDDHEVVQLGLRAALASEPDIDLVWAGATVTEWLSCGIRPDLLLLDLRLADGSSPQANVEAVVAEGIPVLAFTAAENPFHIRQAARAGVSGVLRKSEPAEVIVSAIRQAAAGGTVPGLDWAAALDSDPQLSQVGLSPRQQEVLALYASGADAATVARVLGIQPGTVPDYVSRIRYKYADAGRPARSKMDLYKRAIEDGYLPMPGAPE